MTYVWTKPDTGLVHILDIPEHLRAGLRFAVDAGLVEEVLTDFLRVEGWSPQRLEQAAAAGRAHAALVYTTIW